MTAAPSAGLIGTTRAIAQNISARFSGLLSSLIPSTGQIIYTPDSVYEMTQGAITPPGSYTSITTGASLTTGTWIAPFTGNVQVEVWGGGGGGGGGGVNVQAGDQGGAGGGGGEYACEPDYPVVTGNAYQFTIDTGGAGGVSGSPGSNGNQTTFDTQGVGIPGGVVANGGLGGDVTLGNGGLGGTGSSNTTHNNGGQGGSPGNSNNGQDNPLSVLTSAHLNPWYVFDDAPTGNVTDYSGNNDTGGSAGLLQGVTVAGSPVPQPVQNVTGSDICAFFQGPSVQTILLSGYQPAAAASLTVSCWVNNNGAGYAGQNMRLIANDHPQATGHGLDLFIGGTGTTDNAKGYVYFQMSNTAGTGFVQAVSNASLGASGWSGWHYIVGTWDGTTVRLYIDGVLQTTTGSTTHYSYNSGTTQPFCFGFNPYSNGDFYTGYMSNAYVALNSATGGTIPAGAAMTGAYITAAFGTTPGTGGSGGGGSGGSGGTGGNGAFSSTSSGAAAGAGGIASNFPLNGGTGGGAGGAVDVTGSTGAAVIQPNATTYTPGAGTGGGGGGGGYATVPTLVTETYLPSQSGTYAGPDAVGGQASSLLNDSPANGTIIQGGEVAANGNLNGTQIGMLVLPASVKTQLAGATIRKLTLQFQTVSGAGGTCVLGYTNNTSMPASAPSPTAVKSFKTGTKNGVNNTYDLTATGLGAALISGAATSLTFGNGTTGAYNSGSAASYFMQIAGAGNTNNNSGAAPLLTIEFTTSGGSVAGGAGAPGAICITYTTPSTTPVCSFLDVAVTNDGYGNAMAPGFTGQAAAFEPGQSAGSYTPETWHSLTAGSQFSSSGTIPSHFAGSSSPSPQGPLYLYYRLTPDNEVHITGVLSVSSGASGATWYTAASIANSSYWPVNNKYFPAMADEGAAGQGGNYDYAGTWGCLTTAGELRLYGVGSTTTLITFDVRVPLGI
jgi:hypothetical protein